MSGIWTTPSTNQDSVKRNSRMTVTGGGKWPILTNWRFFLAVSLPLVLCPLLFVQDDDFVNKGTPTERPATKFKCAYVIILMAAYWMVEAIPLAITSLLPIVLFPLLGVQDTAKVSINYMRETNMMFIGGLIIALSVEYCNLHKRIALRVMTLVGSSPIRLMLGIMMTTMLLSMWISNTATTAMMVPIVLAVLGELTRDADIENNTTNIDRQISTVKAVMGNYDDEEHYIDGRRGDQHSYKKEYDDKDKLTERIILEKMYLFAVAYSSNIGGTGVITGTNPNLILQEFLKEEDISQGGKYTDLTFATWMAFNIPGMLLNVIIAWIYLTLVFFGRPNWLKFGGKKDSVAIARNEKNHDNVMKLLQRKYQELGPMTFHEKGVAILFATVVMLWLFRDPRFIKGWAEYVEYVDVGDSTAAMFVVLFLFIIPNSMSFFSGGTSKALMDWKYVQDNLPWGIVLLMGGGFALSDAASVSGLSPWIGDQLNGLQHLDKSVILIVVMMMTAFITEIASNTACANVIIPILLSLSKNLNIHPLYLTLPATVTCSYAFMLPVATPPNAIVFGAGKNMKIMDMVKTGLFLNFSCVIVLFLLNITYGNLLFDYSNYVYANPANISSIHG